jgi:diguanylate cyclase (GGDEF)-like protein
MTGLYNRFGYENKALPLYEESMKKGSRITVLFVDINSMKQINDNYGHEQGDVAIRTVASSIADNLQKDWVAVRYGGDEFLVIVPRCGKQKAATVKKHIEERIEERRKESGLSYPLTASIGFVTSDPENRPDAQLWDYVREADALMYDIKKKMHEAEG